MFKFLKSATTKVALGAVALVPALAMAEQQAVDYTALTSKIDFSGAITAVFICYWYHHWCIGCLERWSMDY